MYSNYGYYNSYARTLETATMIGLIIGLVLAIVLMIAQAKMLKKAGYSGALILVPFYNTYLFYKMSECTGLFWATMICSAAMFFFGSIPLVSELLIIACAVMSIVYLSKLSAAFGHGAGYTIGLLLLMPIFLMILGFGEDEYVLDGGENYAHSPIWYCECGKVNKASALYCPSCNAEKTLTGARAGDMWSCSCGKRNKNSKVYCVSCGAVKPKKF